MVGAGGIGCELLKNLVLTGFGEVHIVDLDTIDLSNLNRQFLFRKEHIKKSKALVARDTAQKFNPNVKIIAHHANIKDPQFNIDWFRSFRIVFNALDNLEARRHVNKMCLAADVPLIESGTTGFNGQVQVIKRGTTECYDCNEKETPKTFPVCTIRSTPSQAIHCIVWAKSYLFAEIFGTSEDDSPELNLTQDSENAAEIEQLKREAQALKRIRASMGTEDFARKVFEKVFTEDINRLRSMEDMWKTRRKPDILDFDQISSEASTVSPSIDKQDQKTWTPAENYAVFSLSLQRLSARLEAARANVPAGNDAAPPILTFDKDDKDTLDFVAAASNLRAIIFSIPATSEFEIKQMAGNIIPAIATTNAMTAGLCVLQAFHVLRNDYAAARMVFLTRAPERVISSEALSKPKPDCPVCGVCQAQIAIDTSSATLEELVESVLKGQLGYDEFSVSSDAGLLYDPDEEDNLSKTFEELGVTAGSFLTIADEQDDEPRVNLVLAVCAMPAVSNTNGEAEAEVEVDMPKIKLLDTFTIARKLPKPIVEAAAAAAAGKMDTNRAASNGSNGLIDLSIADGNHGTKRKRTADDAGVAEDADVNSVRKKGKVFEEKNGAIKGANGTNKEEGIMLGDEDGGAIVIDD
jgi:ubiquitin-like 1-activating enzyme E1 B